MKMIKQSVLLLLLASCTQAVQLNEGQTSNNENANKPGESSDIGIDADAFAEASVQARIDADLEMDRMAKQKGVALVQQQSSDLWKKHFHQSEFFKKYQSHIADREEKRKLMNANKKAYSQLSQKYSALEKEYLALKSKSEATEKQQRELAKKIPGAQTLFASGINGDEDLGYDISMKGQPFHFAQQPQYRPVPGVTFLQQSEDPKLEEKQNLQLGFEYEDSDDEEPLKIENYHSSEADHFYSQLGEAPGDDGKFPEKVENADPNLHAGQHTTFYTQRGLAPPEDEDAPEKVEYSYSQIGEAPGDDGNEPEKVEHYVPPRSNVKTAYYGQLRSHEAPGDDGRYPEKVENYDPNVHAGHHTTFYGQMRSFEAPGDDGRYPEKVENYDPNVHAGHHTTFYSQLRSHEAPGDDGRYPEKVENYDPNVHAGHHTTFYGQMRSFEAPGDDGRYPEKVENYDPNVHAGHHTTFYSQRW